MHRLTLRVRFDGSKPQRAWLLRCEDALLSPLPEGGTHVSDFEGRHGLHHNEKEEDVNENELVSISKAKESGASRIWKSTCSLTFLFLKHPKQVFFNPIKYI